MMRILIGALTVVAVLNLNSSVSPALAQTPAPSGAAATPAGPPAGGPGAAAETQEAPQGFFDIIFSGGIVGLSIILLLAALSLTAAYLVFEHVMTLRRSEIMPDG